MFRPSYRQQVDEVLDWADYKIANGPWNRSAAAPPRRSRHPIIRFLLIGLAVIVVVSIARSLFGRRRSRWF